ncbi:DNA-protecting protein DprA, partial [bacterium]|nr:DNA-protecting protein DprA [bacterium]
KEYPDLLKQIYDPPIALFCKGNVDLLNSKAIGIVGTRTPSRYGKEVAAEFSQGLSTLGYTLVSGAAKGIDTIIHKRSLETGGKTIAVLGNGIDRIYPAENRPLYKDLGDSGLIISEFLMGSKPDAPNFPRRNRIISGLSSGVVVIEAAERSGSLITAYFALDQNREVFAVPGSIQSRQSKGTNMLIRQGAKLVESIDDIIEELGDKYRIGKSVGQQELSISVDPKESEILEQLVDSEEIQIDDLSERTGQSTFALLGILLQMEMKGLIQQLPGKYFKRKS